MNTPLTPDEITVDWLDQTLSADVLGGGTVTGFTLDNIGEGTGIFGEIVRASLDVEGGTGPTSVVIKMACTEPQNLMVAQALGLYPRELAMFDGVVGRSPLRNPACHHAEQSDDGRFVLVLEDMSVDFEVGDQIGGATLEQLERVTDALADFHAHWWEHPDLDGMTWLPKTDEPQYVAAIPPIVEAGLPVLEADWADLIGADAIDLARRVTADFEQVMLRAGRGPYTIVHGDARFDNIFFPRHGEAGADVAFIDFQLCMKARGIADLAYVMSNSAPTDLSAEHWESLARRWHERVTGQGIDYSWDDALSHYRQTTLSYLSSPMSLVGTFDSGNERGAALTSAWVERSFHHAVVCGAADELP